MAVAGSASIVAAGSAEWRSSATGVSTARCSLGATSSALDCCDEQAADIGAEDGAMTEAVPLLRGLMRIAWPRSMSTGRGPSTVCASAWFMSASSPKRTNA